MKNIFADGRKRGLDGFKQRRPCLQDPSDRAWREVDLGALVRNAAVLQETLAPGCQLMPVLKANAYGHGAEKVAKALTRQGVRTFAVASLAEAVELRRRSVRGRILILGYTPPRLAALLARWRLEQTVVDLPYAEQLAAHNQRVRVQIALDTGMHRLGIPAGEQTAIRRVFALPCLQVTGIFSHLCVSDSQTPESKAFTARQLNDFYTAVSRIRAAGLDPGMVHIQASYGIWNLPAQPCNFARAGIALYGVSPDSALLAHPLPLTPVLSLRARVACVRTLAAGERAGYGRIFTAQRATRLAVLTIGYGDGLPRGLAEKGGQVLLQGHRCPMVGRMCMDQLTADVTDLPSVQAGDVATLIGQEGGEVLRAQEQAERCGTIPNELLSGLTARLPIVYV